MIPVYARGGNDKPCGELKQGLQAYIKEGYKALKIRINSLAINRIVRKVSFARHVLDPDIGRAVDAVQGIAKNPWSVKQAVEIAKKLEPYNLMWSDKLFVFVCS